MQDGKLKLDVRFEGETVGLSKQRMAELFQTTKQNVSLHIQNVFSEREVAEDAVVKDSLTIAADGCGDRPRTSGRHQVEPRADELARSNNPQARYGERDILSHSGHISYEGALTNAGAGYDRFKVLAAAGTQPVDTDVDRALNAPPVLPQPQTPRRRTA